MHFRACIVYLVFASAVVGDDKKPLPLITPADAAKHVNQKCIVEMEVKSTGKSNDGKLVFLNSEPSFKDKSNFGVVIDANVAQKMKDAKIDNPGVHFAKKRVRVTGTVTLYREKPQIRLDGPEQIQIVDKN